jgi:ribosomal-protein-alanine N-acetyltransferase
MILEPVGQEAAARVQRVLERAPAYFTRIEGQPVSNTGGEETLNALPDGYQFDQKQVLLVREADQDIGVVDLIRDFPHPGTVMLGLLLIAEELQGHGLGRKAYQLIESWAQQSWGARRFRIGVAEANPVQGFWQKMGFRSTHELRNHEQGKKTFRLFVMEKELAAHRALPSLVGPRVWVRFPRLRDAAELADFFSRNKKYHAPWDVERPEEFYTEEFWKERIVRDLEDFDRGTTASFLVFEKEVAQNLKPPRLIARVKASSVVGPPRYDCNLGYSADEHYQGRGYTTEGASLAVKYLFEEWNLHRVEAGYQPENLASARILEKLGFEKIGLAKKFLYLGGTWQDIQLTAKLNEHWKLAGPA